MPSFSKASPAISANILRGKFLTSAMLRGRGGVDSRPAPDVDEVRADEGQHQPEDNHHQRQPDVHVGAALGHDPATLSTSANSSKPFRLAVHKSDGSLRGSRPLPGERGRAWRIPRECAKVIRLHAGRSTPCLALLRNARCSHRGPTQAEGRINSAPAWETTPHPTWRGTECRNGTPNGC